MRLYARVVGAVVSLVIANSAWAVDTFWIADSNTILGTVPVAPGVATPTMIGSGLTTSLTDLTWDHSGHLWGIGGLGFQHFFSVNPTTGIATDLGDLGTPLNSLACAPDGTLYAAYSGLYKINPVAVTLTPIGGLGFQASGDLAFVGSTLYMSAQDPGGFGGSDVLVNVNTLTGAGTLVGPIGFSGIFGLATGSDGTLYGGFGNHIITINTLTGASAPFETWFSGANGTFGGVMGMDILTTPDAPEPASLALLSVAAVPLMFRRRNR